jgi:hypothetical protein
MSKGVNNIISQRSNFETYEVPLGVIILILIFLFRLVYLLLFVSIYRLTNYSLLHVILYMLLGSFYLSGVVIYYVLSGYKYCKVN